MNIVLAGNSSNITFGDPSDSIVMRISSTGVIEWLSHININSGGSSTNWVLGISLNTATNTVYALNGNPAYYAF